MTIYRETDAEARFSQTTYDVVVNEDTAAGIMAAVSAARNGAKVALLSSAGRPGGIMTQAAVCATDLWFKTPLRGLAARWFQELAARKLSAMDAATISPVIRNLTNTDYNRATSTVWTGNGVNIPIVYDDRLRYWMPSEAEALFREWITRSGVDYFPGVYQPEKADVVVEGDRIAAIITNAGRIYGKQFVEASMEADLLAGSGVPYTWGRESAAQYGEGQAGVLNNEETVYPGVNMRDDAGNPLYPLIADDGRALGAGDSAIMAFNLRMVIGLTSLVSTVPFWKPANYDASKFELLVRLAVGRNWTSFNNFAVRYDLRNGYYNTNNSGHPAQLDLANRSWGWADGSRSVREALYREHRDYNVGALWTLANDPRVPSALRADVNRYGFAPSEWSFNQNVPPIMYAREGRRMVGKYVLTQSDIRATATKTDLIARCVYPADCHGPRTFLKSGTDNVVIEDGGMYEPIDDETGLTLSNDFHIGMDSLVPPSGSIKNLTVCVPVSCSHVVWAPLRMEPCFMMLGEGAGAMAASAAASGLAVQNLAYTGDIKARLQRTGLLA